MLALVLKKERPGPSGSRLESAVTFSDRRWSVSPVTSPAVRSGRPCTAGDSGFLRA